MPREPGVPLRVLGLRQLDMHEVFSTNEARIRHGDAAEPAPDVCIVGSGAGGGVLAGKLAEAGFRVVVLEAGPFWVPERDWVSDEKGQAQLYWRDARVSGGDDPIELGANNSGRGVGGSTAHYAMVKLRLHRDDFRLRSARGVGDDWPIAYADLAPYYDEVESELGVAGPTHFPWGEFHGPYAQRAHPPSSQSSRLLEGCERLGLRAVAAPNATLSSPKDGRPPCTYRGFCVYGCKPNAKSSQLVTYIPKAIAAGAIVKHGSMATRINTRSGRVVSVTYRHGGRAFEQRARTFILAGYAIETPRLLLNSACDEAPAGLANGSGLVGKRLMTHASHRVYARFDALVRPYKGPPGLALTQEFYDPPEDADFPCGYTIESVAALPLAFVKYATRATQAWGWDVRRLMLDYNHYTGFGLNGECLPSEENEVRLSDERDQHGVRIPHVRFRWGDAEKRMVRHGEKQLRRIAAAAGGKSAFFSYDSAHLMGTCRMGDDPKTSVVDAWCRSHDVPNLFICDGSVFVTSSAANPSLTIEALAARTADYLARVRE